MKRFWNWLLEVALKKSGREILLIPEGFGPVLTVAKALVEEAGKATDVSGEWRRHQVYAAMIKIFPDMPKRVIGLAIEVVINARADN